MIIILLNPPFSATAVFNCHHDSSLWFPSHRFGQLIHDPSEIAKQKVADASQRMRRMNGQSEELRGRLNPVTELQPELEIKILENAPRNLDKLRRLLKVKQRQKEEEAMHIEDTERLHDGDRNAQGCIELISRSRN